jgi:hypothetical protein
MALHYQKTKQKQVLKLINLRMLAAFVCNTGTGDFERRFCLRFFGEIFAWRSRAAGIELLVSCGPTRGVSSCWSRPRPLFPCARFRFGPFCFARNFRRFGLFARA